MQPVAPTASALPADETVEAGEAPLSQTAANSGTVEKPRPVDAATPEAQSAADSTADSVAVGEASTADWEAGMAVYRAQYCGVCHVLDAAETRGTFGPPHNGMGAIAAARIQEPEYSGQAETAAQYLRESIVDPKAYIVPDYAMTSHSMPPYSHLPADELEALVLFLLAQ